MSDICIKY